MQTNTLSPKSSYSPSPSLMRFCYALISTECRGKKTLAQAKTGVPKMQFYREWKRSPDFREWYKQQCDEFLKVNRPIVDMHLMIKVKQGNVQAIRTYYEIEEKIKSAVNVHVNNIETNVFVELQGKSDDELLDIANRARTASLN